MDVSPSVLQPEIVHHELDVFVHAHGLVILLVRVLVCVFVDVLVRRETYS